MARFERSTLPGHKGTRTVVLRFLKIITPVECVIPLYDGYIVQPKEGDLYRTWKSLRRIAPELDQPAWSVDIDGSNNSMTQGLRLLWDT